MTALPPIRRVLLALTDSGYGGTSLESVRHASQALSAELHVLRVVPSFVPRHPFFASMKLRDPAMISRRTGEAHSRTCKWVAATLGEHVSLQNVRTQSGELVEQLSKRARELDCQLIVLSPSLTNVGDVATSLARSANVPVLIARGHVENGAIFAASDLQDPDFRVLQCGSRLAQELGARLVTFHNVDPLPAVNATALGVVPSITVDSVVSPTQRGNCLAEASRRLSTPATPVVRSNIDPVQAILTEAKVRDADVVVVGTHYKSWWERVLSGSVARRVAARADRSVVVMPLADAPPSAP